MRPRCRGKHTAPRCIPARALMTACTKCEATIPVPARRHLQAVPAPAAAAAAPADLVAPAADPAPRKPRKLSAREQMIRSDYLDYVQYLEDVALVECNGVFLNRAGKLAYEAGRIGPSDMFTKPWRQVQKYASWELVECFQKFGRMSWTEYRAQFNNERAQAS